MADVLVIDEISMVSARTLDFVNHICQYLKKNDLVMGGIQCIFVGDFLQLPPMPDHTVNDKGLYAFQLPTFNTMVPHKVELVIVSSQVSMKFIATEKIFTCIFCFSTFPPFS